jgi:hypothetical protein
MDIDTVIKNSALAQELYDHMKKEGGNEGELEYLIAVMQFMNKPVALKYLQGSKVDDQVKWLLKEADGANIGGSAKTKVKKDIADIEKEIKDDLEKKKPKAAGDYEKRKREAFKPFYAEAKATVSDSYSRLVTKKNQAADDKKTDSTVDSLKPEEAKARMVALASVDAALTILTGRVRAPADAIHAKLGAMLARISADLGPDNILQPLESALKIANQKMRTASDAAGQLRSGASTLKDKIAALKN